MTATDHNSPLAKEAIAGPPEGPVVVLLHGFTQNRRCWGPFAEILGERFGVWAIDLPGHGDSKHETSSFEVASTLAGDAIRSIDRPVELIVGYSMGGRIALRAAIDDPSLSRSVALIGATAGLAALEERAHRREADQRLALRLRTDGPESFLDFWLGLDLFGGLTDEQQQRRERLDLWGSGVAETLLHRGTGSMEPLWDRLLEIQARTLVVAGERDHKFTEIGERLSIAIGSNATLCAISDAGHACHLEAPALTADAIVRWIDTPQKA